MRRSLARRSSDILTAPNPAGDAHEHPEARKTRHRLRRGLPRGYIASGGSRMRWRWCRMCGRGELRPFFLNPGAAEASARDEYLTQSSARSRPQGIAGRVVAPGEEGLSYHPELVKRQPQHHRLPSLIHWAEQRARPQMKQRLMELYFRDAAISPTSTCWCGRPPISPRA